VLFRPSSVLSEWYEEDVVPLAGFMRSLRPLLGCPALTQLHMARHNTSCAWLGEAEAREHMLRGRPRGWEETGREEPRTLAAAVDVLAHEMLLGNPDEAMPMGSIGPSAASIAMDNGNSRRALKVRVHNGTRQTPDAEYVWALDDDVGVLACCAGLVPPRRDR
jgi:hypothetical protein